MSGLEKAIGGEVSRRSFGFYANNRTAYKLGRMATIECPSDTELFDFTQGALQGKFVFTLSAGLTASQTLSLASYWPALLFSEIRVKTMDGRQMGDSLRFYGGKTRERMLLCNTGDYATGAKLLQEWPEGITYQAASVDAAGDITVEFSHKISDHIFMLKHYYPGQLHKGFILEIDLCSITDIFSDSNSGTEVALITNAEIQDLEYYVDLVRIDAESEANMLRIRNEGNLYVDFSQVISDVYDYASGSTLRKEQIGINGRIKNCIVTQYLSSGRGSSGNAFWREFVLNGLTGYRFFVMNKPINHRIINVSDYSAVDGSTTQLAKAQFELYKALEKEYLNPNTYGPNTSAADRSDTFAIGVKIQKGNENLNPGYITSEVDNTRNNTRFELDLSGASASTVYFHTEVDKRIQLLPGGVVNEVRL